MRIGAKNPSGRVLPAVVVNLSGLHAAGRRPSFENCSGTTKSRPVVIPAVEPGHPLRDVWLRTMSEAASMQLLSPPRSSSVQSNGSSARSASSDEESGPESALVLRKELLDAASLPSAIKVTFSDQRLGLRVQQDTAKYANGHTHQMVFVTSVTRSDLPSNLKKGYVVAQVGDLKPPSQVTTLKQQLKNAGRPVTITFVPLPPKYTGPVSPPPAAAAALPSSSGAMTPGPRSAQRSQDMHSISIKNLIAEGSKQEVWFERDIQGLRLVEGLFDLPQPKGKELTRHSNADADASSQKAETECDTNADGTQPSLATASKTDDTLSKSPPNQPEISDICKTVSRVSVRLPLLMVSECWDGPGFEKVRLGHFVLSVGGDPQPSSVTELHRMFAHHSRGG